MKVGDVIKDYRITDKIGAGGMAIVYLAEHLHSDRKVAIKALQPELSNNSHIVRRFFNEARAGTAIRHPGIVEVFESGYHEDNTAYIIMEYLHGESLKQRLKRVSRFSEAQALAIVREIAVALAAAHQKGFIHRDLKPDNIFLVPDAQVPSQAIRRSTSPTRWSVNRSPGGEHIKILDFGIAKRISNTVPNMDGTVTRVMLGTPTYVSPEQVRAEKDIDQRADLYSLGCILFKLLAGRPPFVAEASDVLVAQHLDASPPSVQAFVPAVSDGTADLVAQLLAKHPDDRFPSADDLVGAIDTILQGGMVAPEPLPSQHPQGAGYGSIDATASQRTVNPLADSSHGGPMVSMHGKARTSNAILWIMLVVILGIGVTFIVASRLSGKQAGKSVEDPARKPFGRSPWKLRAGQVDVAIDSVPPGADVYQMPAHKLLGKTPYRGSIPRTAGKLTFVVQLADHHDAVVTLPADQGGQQTVELRPLSESE